MNDRQIVDDYHDRTKHHFHRFARSAGHLDWASQPKSFRTFQGSPAFPLYPAPAAGLPDHPVVQIGFRSLGEGALPAPAPLTSSAIGDLLRHALGLSAWKHYHESRWSLRVNPSSGNLHPTEAYLVCPPLPGLAETAAVYHYAPDRHALELRCAFDSTVACSPTTLLVALTSIPWREAWKYGERAFRYCQHDLGHAVAAVTLAAATLGWRVRILPSWSHRDVATVAGVDRDGDFVEAEHEEPACALAIATAGDQDDVGSVTEMTAAARSGRWFGRANQLSERHTQWPVIDEVARATVDTARTLPVLVGSRPTPQSTLYERSAGVPCDARALFLRRRSALAFDGRSAVPLGTFMTMLSRVMPDSNPPWDVMWWTPRIHLAIFVHRVSGLSPGLYLLARDPHAVDTLRTSCNADLAWVRTDDRLPLFCLARGDCRALAERLSCDQDLAADGFCSLGMIAAFEASLTEHGPSFYRHLFWESGIVGQILYLEAELAGARATGIGCFYDDAVHEALGLKEHAFQSLYHFSLGMPVEDLRLTARPGYEWEG